VTQHDIHPEDEDTGGPGLVVFVLLANALLFSGVFVIAVMRGAL